MPPKLVNESGNIITDQYQILQEAKTYYENLYSKRDTVSNINLKNEIPYTGIPTLSDELSWFVPFRNTSYNALLLCN
jgi:hypothetical protein